MGRAFEYRRASKEARWDRMSKIFPKLAKSITMAVKEGGPDPESNSKLRLAIANAKAQNMPKDNVESAIRRASGKDAADYAEVNYEGKGPHGVLIFVETATDNTNRTVSNLKTIFNKGGGQIVQTGSLEFLFDRKAVIEFPVPEGQDLDEIELALIDAGLEELEVSEGTAYAYGDFKDFGKLNQGVLDLGITPSKSSLKRIPNAPQEFSDDQLEEIETLIDKIEDDEDVQAVYTNIA
ncbi:MAG: YebC/PmpR family DNA-binding transcriptional regulator [Verrucomicrobiae bacterium]|nr:YebC/PmpR family DNA-binding transcriptional regulator [Verrucomicrobiae bacterium]MCB1091691.1 YebC/PmpR family DNA-binding transcriptional regulator [Verrucomicrobiae bacterium]